MIKLASINSTMAGRTGSAVAERALLGGVTFAVTVMLGRWGGPEELGLFAVLFPLVFIAIALQESMVIVPYMVYAANHTAGESRRRYLGSVLVHSAILGAVVAAAFVLASGGSAATGAWAYADALAILAIACPCVLLREFARRIVYAERKPGVAVLISGGVGGLQLAAMGGLYAADRLTAASAFAAMGVSSVLGGGLWLYLNRRAVQLRGAEIAAAFRLNWSLGGWSLGTQVSEIVSLHMFPWLLVIAADEATAGVYAACAVLASLPQPLHNALSNVLVPELVHLRKQHGDAAATRLMLRAAAGMALVLAAFLIAVAALSTQLLAWTYGAKFDSFSGTAHALIVLAAAQLIIGAALPAARALLVFERPREVFYAQAAGIAVNIAAGVPLIALWGIAGAAYAALAGATVKAALVAWWYGQEMRGAPAGRAPHRPPAAHLPASPTTEGAS